MLDESAIWILTFPRTRIGNGIERETRTQELCSRVMRVLVDNHDKEAGSSS